MAGRTWAAMIAAALAAAMFGAPGAAQTYPTKPVRLILPYNPGGIIDFIGRTVAHGMSETLGQNVVAENRPGAGGIVGTNYVANAQADGYTLLFMDPAIDINPTLQPSVPYDLFKQLDPISVVGSSPEVLVVAPQLGITSFDALVAYGKAHPGKLNFASAGVGTTPHLAAEMFKQRTGIEATHVPYKGIGASFVDLMSNKVQFAFSSIAGALPFTQNKRVLPLATTGDKRSAVYPDLPTVAEAGLPGFNVDLWVTIFAPVGLPSAVRAKLDTAIKEALKRPDVVAAFATVGVEPRGTTPAEAAAFVKADSQKWKHVITEAKIKLE